MASTLQTLLKFQSAMKAFGKTYRLAILSVVGLAFIIGLIFSIKALNLSLSDIHILPLLGVLFMTQPLLVLFNSLEFKLCGDAISVDMPLSDAALVSTGGTIANILPLPGGLLLRGGILAKRGASVKNAGLILFYAALLWMAMALLVSAFFINLPNSAFIFAAAGIILTGIASLAILKMSSPFITAKFLSVRIIMLALLTLQLKLCFDGLGYETSFSGAAVYVVSGIAGTVVSIIPAGLGIVEGFGAVLAKIEGTSAAAAFLVLSLHRLFGLASSGLYLAILGRQVFTKPVSETKA